mmetsp:Transcript_8560/g.21144  ORF Transcript_8560/g.21144 Transcript_8560/m.21144 type:complete len:229 (+) Transcript_8560:126-812(+)
MARASVGRSAAAARQSTTGARPPSVDGHRDTTIGGYRWISGDGECGRRASHHPVGDNGDADDKELARRPPGPAGGPAEQDRSVCLAIGYHRFIGGHMAGGDHGGRSRRQRRPQHACLGRSPGRAARGRQFQVAHQLPAGGRGHQSGSVSVPVRGRAGTGGGKRSRAQAMGRISGRVSLGTARSDAGAGGCERLRGERPTHARTRETVGHCITRRVPTRLFSFRFVMPL